MKSISIIPAPIVFLLLSLGLAACDDAKPGTADHADHADNAAAHTEEIVKGPHGGRLLRDGDFALEVSIFERGVPPEFRLYPTQGGKPIALKDVQVTMGLRRISGLPGGVTDQHTFVAKDDYLWSAAEVYEPHSFTFNVSAIHAGKTHAWQYESPEGEVSIAADMAQAAGLKVAAAGEGMLHQTLSLYGVIQPDPEKMRSVTARFPGPVRSVSVNVGDAVRKGQTLATIESNESLQVYAVAAPIAGTVTARRTNPGESAGSEALFEIADFSSVRAELNVFPRDRGALKPGQAVRIKAADGAATGEGSIGFVAPVGTAMQALVARVVLDNRAAQWTPGQFINAEVTVGSTPAPLVVPLAALQTFRDWDVVFVNEGERYQAQPVTLGRRDGERVEIVSGLKPGAAIVVENSYLVKADIEKSGASHDH
ncbi:MAG: efflux RND transporter periplasmic adaptor subunit [Stagnimonas sp.]|nr:efflux RND transporter periplasmic adaptor subunit [Stagnimonas sp.]